MVRLSDQLERSRRETKVLSEIAALSGSTLDYQDVVRSILDLVEQLISPAFLGLSIKEADQIAHYARAGKGTDAAWAEEAGRCMAEIQSRRLAHSTQTRHVTRHQMLVPPAWFVDIPAETRSGRAGVMVLGEQAPIELNPEEEQLVRRLAQHALLVLDHALLLDEIEDRAMVDDLTGVTNQRRLLEILDYEMQRHRHSGTWLALMMVDVEGLDSINRSYGRRYGNHILQKLAGLLQDAVRPIDVVARCGLDEFAVVLPETDEEEAQTLSQHLRERILGVEFAGGSVGLSVGVAHAKPDEVISVETFLLRGEQALEAAKRQDRGWTAMWGQEMRRAVR